MMQSISLMLFNVDLIILYVSSHSFNYLFNFIHFAIAISPMCYDIVFSCCQGLSKAHMQRLHMLSITGSTLIFLTTSHTTW